MPLELQFATEADAERAAQIEREAFGPDEFSPIMFPGPFPEPAPGKTTRAQEMANAFRSDPSTRWLKIVDTDIAPTEDNKQMIGFAQWNINDGTQIPPAPRVFGEGCNAEACDAVFKGLHKVRLEYLKTKHLHLRYLFVDPQHHRRGAGTTLIKWGVDEAGKLGFPAYVESSRVGHALYLRSGFRDLDTHSVDFTEWGHPATHITYIMGTQP
ncbi:acyl-CoA N-acyltransferase [Xylaria sp. FL1042]|nr:acyl-CoA N-acyltransferase [Xylaria sp. FL1042]